MAKELRCSLLLLVPGCRENLLLKPIRIGFNKNSFQNREKPVFNQLCAILFNLMLAKFLHADSPDFY